MPFSCARRTINTAIGTERAAKPLCATPLKTIAKGIHRLSCWIDAQHFVCVKRNACETSTRKYGRETLDF